MVAASTKRYVDVIARWHASGDVEPLLICWPDGRTFQINRVIGSPQSSTFPGVVGRTLRYSILVEGRRTRLFLELGEDNSKEHARWYVEQAPGAIPWEISIAKGTRQVLLH